MSVRTTSYILMRLMSNSRACTCVFLTRTISFIRNSMRFFARLIRVFRLAYTRAVLYFLSILKIIVQSKLIKIHTHAVCKHAHHRKKLVPKSNFFQLVIKKKLYSETVKLFFQLHPVSQVTFNIFQKTNFCQIELTLSLLRSHW